MEIKRQTMTMTELINKFFAVGEAPTGKTFVCRLCGVLMRSVKGVGKHWRNKHQHDENISVE